MNDVLLADFEKTICATHGADQAMYTGRAIIREVSGSGAVWEGEVLSFILQGHPTATTCYAWELDGRVTTMLRIGPIDSPAMAVRASILAVAECE